MRMQSLNRLVLFVTLIAATLVIPATIARMLPAKRSA